MMRPLLGAVCALTFTSTAFAQELPQPSPHARVEQTVGVTEISVDYSSPGVKGRVILGKLLPLGTYWRAGANAATTVTFSNDVTMLGKSVKAGSYRLGMMPEKKGWTAVLSEEGGSATDLDEAKVVAKARVTSKVIRSRERLTYFFENTRDHKTDLVLEWSTFKVIVPIEVDTQAHVAKVMDEAMRDSWATLMRTGRYLKNQGKHEEALVHFDKSLAVKKTWWSTWYKAESMAALGKKKEAVELAKSAQTLGNGDNVFERFFKKDVEEALVAWAK
ncbi:MAG: DUF2911 domain-containing protein [Myxococcota bacterium]